MSASRLLKRRGKKAAARGEAKAKAACQRARQAELHVSGKQILYEQQLKIDTARNNFRIMAYALHESFGFGEKRLKKLMAHMKQNAGCLKDKRCHVTARDFGRILETEAKFKLEPTDEQKARLKFPTREDIIQIELIYEMSANVCLVLHDKFGYGQKRLERFYKASSAIAHRISTAGAKAKGDEIFEKIRKWLEKKNITFADDRKEAA